jgi:hypothetical protein
MKTIGYFEELQPNGMIARSSTRIMCMISLVAALALMFLTVYWQISTEGTLLVLLHDNVVKPSEVPLMASAMGPGEVMLGFVFTLLTYAFGFKAYTKRTEQKGIDKDTPVKEMQP